MRQPAASRDTDRCRPHGFGSWSRMASNRMAWSYAQGTVGQLRLLVAGTPKPQVLDSSLPFPKHLVVEGVVPEPLNQVNPPTSIFWGAPKMLVGQRKAGCRFGSRNFSCGSQGVGNEVKLGPIPLPTLGPIERKHHGDVSGRTRDSPTRQAQAGSITGKITVAFPNGNPICGDWGA